MITIEQTIHALDNVRSSIALERTVRNAAQWSSAVLAALRAESGLAWNESIDRLYSYAVTHKSIIICDKE